MIDWISEITLADVHARLNGSPTMRCPLHSQEVGDNLVPESNPPTIKLLDFSP